MAGVRVQLSERYSPSPGRGGLLGRVLGEGEAPTWWGVPVGRVAGCEVRVHLVALVFGAAALAYSVWNGPAAPFVGTGLAALIAVVVGHEAVRGHALVRWAGLRPVAVTFWPLGAVWDFAPDEADPRIRARGELVGAGLGWLGAVCMGGLAALAVRWIGGHWGALLAFSPTQPLAVPPEMSTNSTASTLGRLFVWNCYTAGLSVAGVNLLPMLPLDGGVVARSLWDREPGSTRAPRVGLVVATLLGAGGLLTGLPLAAALGLCGGVVCWHAWQACRFAVDPAGVDRWRRALAGSAGPGGSGGGTGETGAGAGPIPAEDRERVERILSKISEHGMASLTRSERRELRRATERLREAGG